MTIQAVFFDMGGTIQTYWHTPELRLKATPGLQQRLLAAGIDLHLSDAQLYQVVTDGLSRCHRRAIETLDELPAERVWSECILAGYDVDPHRLAVAAEDLTFYVETHYYHRQMRAEIPAALQAIQQMGLKMGLISNVLSHRQAPANLEQYGIRQYFDPVVLSCEYGRRKPDPAIFHYAARLAGAPTSGCVYVGDRVARDIVGARRAGYRLAIQIQHDFEHGEADEGAHPDAIIGQMTELLDILRSELDRPSGDSLAEVGNVSPIRAILFDAGDILYYRPRRGSKLAAFLKDLSLDMNDDHAETKKSLVDRAYQGRISQEQYQEGILRMYGVTQTEQIERGKQIMEEEDHDLEFFEGVAETLAALKEEGYLLGVVTDTASPVYIKLNWFERGGFGNVWDTIISSKELGVRKPAAKIYHAALQQLGLHAEQAVFVGHKASELEGAKAVGMQTVAFNYDPTAKADYYIKRFTDLLNLFLLSGVEKESVNYVQEN